MGLVVDGNRWNILTKRVFTQMEHSDAFDNRNRAHHQII